MIVPAASGIAQRQQQDTAAINRSLIGITGGLGVTLVLATDIVDYINNTYQILPKLGDFATAAEFFGAGEIRLGEEWNLKLEYAYLLKSYDVPTNGFGNTISYSVHMPTVILQRVIEGRGYLIKYGGGVGYHFGSLTTHFPPFEDTYTASGVGLKLDGEGDTEFDEHFYGLIAVDVRDDILGQLKDSGDNPLSGSHNPKLGFLSVGLKFGVVWFF